MLFSFCRVSVSRAIKPFAEPGRPPDWFSQKVSSQVHVLLEHFLRCKVGSLPGPARPPNPSTTPVFFKYLAHLGFPGCSAVKNPANVGDMGWTPGREDPWRRKWQPSPVFLPGKSHGQRSLDGLQFIRSQKSLTQLGN